jgi:hypothetical protein
MEIETEELGEIGNIVFIHVPRTGGKTFRRLAFNRLQKKVFSKYLHFPGDYTNFDVNETKVFTLIRDPTERYNSEYKAYYSFYKMGALPPMYREMYEREKIVDYQSFVDAEWTHNTQTKMLLGYILYQKEKVTEEDADKILKRIENDEIIPLRFTDMIDIIEEYKNMKPEMNERFFRVEEKRYNTVIDETVDSSNCNKVDEYLYNSIVTKYKEKTEIAKQIARKLILKQINQ